ncbi:MAG: Hsp70 family protein [Limisphaerales bacterium]
MISQTTFLVGIDLGTSNCAVAYVEPAQGPEAPVVDFPVPQLERPGEAGPRPLLPSCLYLPSPHEMAPEATRLPWGEEPEVIVGEFARWRGARVPGRLVASAKSWLCHAGVDRSAPILPWGAPPEVKKVSPVEASARLLRHIARAWDMAHPDGVLAEQEVIVTVPASFDEVARALTVSAAKQAGLERFTLVEEPQAAFYDFTARHRHDLGPALKGIRLVLVVDVGGGTSDFTLVQAGASPEGPALRRIAVGEHLMLGGDNMDAALGRKAEERMLAGGRKLSAAQWSQLAQAARAAKESLLSESGPEQFNLSITAEGSRLIGTALSTRITRADAEGIILEGFLPACGPEEAPRRGGRVALQELGLPYAHDPAITRHLAAFLRAHAAAGFAALGAEAASPGLPRPDAILLNGGVFNSQKIAGRLVEAISAWWPGAPTIPLLRHDSLELAVARGAAYYGLVRRGLGRRIGGGAAHALYVGLEKAAGREPLALCVIPRGQEEGESVDLGGRVFELALERPVRFPLFSSASDRFEKPGEVVPVSEDMRALPPIHTLLKGGAGKAGSVPVHLRSGLTEIGTLELWCVAQSGRERWRLEFELRGAETEAAPTVTESMPAAFADARRWVERIFGGKPRPVLDAKGAPPKDVKQLWASLERTLGPREEWRLPVLREMWSVLFAGASKRRRSPDHERIFFQLLGYTLRPGFGYPLDEWRCEQSARLFSEGVQFHKEKAIWTEFWVLWRRVAGGLSQARHQEIWNWLKPYLQVRASVQAPKALPKPKGIQPEGLDEMVRLGASLEHLDPADKAALGAAIVARLRDPAAAGGPWLWALGRLGARAPIYGSVHKTLPAQQAAQWVEGLLDPRIIKLDGAAFALAQLARLTGDRSRDLEPELRARVLDALRAAPAPPSWERMVREVVAMEAADRVRALGDTLPVGLAIRDEPERPEGTGTGGCS